MVKTTFLKMRLRIQALLCGAALLVLQPGCSSEPKPTALQPVGPAPRSGLLPDNAGYLLVYSAWSHFVDPGSTAHHSRYTVTADDGTLSREVINHVDRFDEGPLRLPLSPGSYHIKARSAHFGRVNVPILIQPRQTTFVYLDGSAHSAAPSAQGSTAVKLPDGEIIGWSATTASNHP